MGGLWRALSPSLLPIRSPQTPTPWGENGSADSSTLPTELPITQLPPSASVPRDRHVPTRGTRGSRESTELDGRGQKNPADPCHGNDQHGATWTAAAPSEGTALGWSYSGGEFRCISQFNQVRSRFPAPEEREEPRGKPGPESFRAGAERERN